MKALVTGAAGFVGSALSEKLLGLGHQVVGIDCLTDYYSTDLKRENLDRLRGANFSLIEENINEADIDSILQDDINIVFHQAGQPGVRKSWGSDFDTYVNCNVSATQKLLEAAKRSGSVDRFVYASSSSIYGNAESYPTTEEMRPQPLSPYGVTKLAAEHLCSLYASNFAVPTVSLRYFTVYGPGQRPDMAFTRFTQAAASGNEITLFGTGDQIRDFTYISDVVDANIAAATGDLVPGEILNVAGGSNISVNGALEIIADLSDTKLNITRTGTVDGDVYRTGGSTEKIRRLLDWAPKVSIADGLRKHFEWAEARVGKSHHG